jgi:hypothetical protein
MSLEGQVKGRLLLESLLSFRISSACGGVTSCAAASGGRHPYSPLLRNGARGSRAAELSSASHLEETPGEAIFTS